MNIELFLIIGTFLGIFRLLIMRPALLRLLARLMVVTLFSEIHVHILFLKTDKTLVYSVLNIVSRVKRLFLFLRAFAAARARFDP